MSKRNPPIAAYGVKCDLNKYDSYKKMALNQLKKECRDLATDYALELYEKGQLKNMKDDEAVVKIADIIKDVYEKSPFKGEEHLKEFRDVAVDSFVRAKYRVFNNIDTMSQKDPMNPNRTR